jgi:hypothetical protein
MTEFPHRLARVPGGLRVIGARSCGTCNAFTPNKSLNPRRGEPRQGWCVANPPGLVVGAGPAGPLNPGQMVPVHTGAWPPTMADKFCRAWEPNDEVDDDGSISGSA